MASTSPPIESKVQSSSLWSLGASIGIAALNAVAGHSELLGSLPALAQFVILAVIPPAMTFFAGYVAPSTPRPDLYTYGDPAEPWLPEPPPPNPPAPAYQDEPHYRDGRYSDAPFTAAPGFPADPGRHRA